jgi:dUTP pyrophosphatase
MEVLFQKLDPEAIVPKRMTDGAAGFDLYSSKSVTIEPSQIGLIETGIAVQFPDGYYGSIKGRSSTALNGMICHNGTSKYKH